MTTAIVGMTSVVCAFAAGIAHGRGDHGAEWLMFVAASALAFINAFRRR